MSEPSRNDMDMFPGGQPDVVTPVVRSRSDSSEDGGRRRHTGHHGGRSRRPSRRRTVDRKARRIRMLILAVCVAVVCYIAYLGVSALIIKREASAALSSAAEVQVQLQNSLADPSAKEGLKTSLDTFADHVSAIHDQTKSPGWALLEWIPYYGHDVKVARETVRVLDDIGDNALPQLRNALSAMDYADFGISDGVVRLPGLSDASIHLDMADTTMQNADTELQLVGDAHIEQLNDMLSVIKPGVNTATQAVDVLTRFAKVAPTMLDVDGGQTQTYLILAENNAELRATGGLPGSWGTLTVSGGTLTLSDFVPDTSIPIQDESVLQLTDEELNLYGDQMGRIPHDVNITPDFPRAAQAAKALWEKAYPDQPVDGVMAMDPVFLQDLLQVTGGVTLQDGRTLDGTNTVQTLLHDVYLESNDANWQNEFFAQAARTAFERIVHMRNTDLARMVQTVVTSVNNGHLKVWHDADSIQNELSGTAIAGEIENSESHPAVGVYFNDAGQSKMDWYLDRHVTTTLRSTQADGSKLYDVDIELSNTLQAQDVTSLPDYVLGDGVDGLRPGELAVNLYLYAPDHGRLADWVFPDDGEFDLLTTHDGLTVGAKRLVLQPGQSMSIHITVQTSAAAVQTALQVRQTPVVKE